MQGDEVEHLHFTYIFGGAKMSLIWVLLLVITGCILTYLALTLMPPYLGMFFGAALAIWAVSKLR